MGQKNRLVAFNLFFFFFIDYLYILDPKFQINSNIEILSSIIKFIVAWQKNHKQNPEEFPEISGEIFKIGSC